MYVGVNCRLGGGRDKTSRGRCPSVAHAPLECYACALGVLRMRIVDAGLGVAGTGICLLIYDLCALLA